MCLLAVLTFGQGIEAQEDPAVKQRFKKRNSRQPRIEEEIGAVRVTRWTVSLLNRLL
jgi:hypothetical protein